MESYSEPGFTEPDNSRLFFYGLLFGAALGAAAGMLLAPRKGAAHSRRAGRLFRLRAHRAAERLPSIPRCLDAPAVAMRWRLIARGIGAQG